MPTQDIGDGDDDIDCGGESLQDAWGRLFPLSGSFVGMGKSLFLSN